MPQGSISRVKCYCLLNLNQVNKPLLSLVCQNPIFQQDLVSESEMLLQTLLSYQSSKRALTPVQKIYSQSGVWYCTMRFNMAIGLLVSTEFPVTSCMRLLKKIEDLIKSKLNPIMLNEIQQAEPLIREYLNQYDNNCYADDVLDMTAKSMDSIQGHMEDNIKKIVQNHQALQVVHHKSEEVANVAGQFQKNATELKNKPQWQQYLVYGVVATVLGGVTIYILSRIF